MLPDRVLNPGPPTYESGALPIALRGLAKKLTRRSTRILTQSLQSSTALQTSLEKRMPTL